MGSGVRVYLYGTILRAFFVESMGGDIQADHIRRFSEYPELRFDLNNGRTLCTECHKKITYGN